MGDKLTVLLLAPSTVLFLAPSESLTDFDGAIFSTCWPIFRHSSSAIISPLFIYMPGSRVLNCVFKLSLNREKERNNGGRNFRKRE